MGKGKTWCGTRDGDREDGGEGAGGPRAEKEGGGRRVERGGSERGLTAEGGRRRRKYFSALMVIGR